MLSNLNFIILSGIEREEIVTLADNSVHKAWSTTHTTLQVHAIRGETDLENGAQTQRGVFVFKKKTWISFLVLFFFVFVFHGPQRLKAFSLIVLSVLALSAREQFVGVISAHFISR